MELTTTRKVLRIVALILLLLVLCNFLLLYLYHGIFFEYSGFRPVGHEQDPGRGPEHPHLRL